MLSVCISIYTDEQSKEFPECNQIQVNMGFVQYSVNRAVLTSRKLAKMDVFKVKDIQ